jgi:TolB-like protein
MKNRSGSIPGLAIFERSSLNTVIAEAKLAMSGLVEEESAVKIGNLTEVDAVVIGSIQELAGVFVVSARLVDTANGMIIGTGRGELPAAFDGPAETNLFFSDSTIKLFSGEFFIYF